MWWTAIIPFVLQGVCIFVDETVFHLNRGLPKWERIGHPLDTLSVLLCLEFVLWVPFSQTALIFYGFLSLFSTIFVTKDEFVHKKHCPASEQWLHALLFTLHPLVLIVTGFLWPVIQNVPVAPWISSWLENPLLLRFFLIGQCTLLILFGLYQVVYWNFVRNNDQQPIL